MQIRHLSVLASTLLVVSAACAAEPKSTPNAAKPQAAEAAAQETVTLAISGMT